MPIKPPPNIKDFAQNIHNACNGLMESARRSMIQIGLEAVDEARTHHKYLDQSGNLTSSVGYVLVENGAIISQSSFEPVKETATLGPPAGIQYAQELATQHPTGLVLIVVAGMDYATFVEVKGLGGMTGAELYAKERAKEMLSDLVKGVNTIKKSML